MKNKQLYTFISHIEYPAVDRFDPLTGEVISIIKKYEGYYSYRWPDGSTCIPIEMFLVYLSDTKTIKISDGGTVGVYARNLTHLVRYCYTKGVQFWDLQTSHIDELISNLSSELNEYNERVRNNNTVLTIISNVITFLKWIQTEYFPTQNIIGVDSACKRHQIKLATGIKNYGKGTGRAYEYFPSKLPTSITQAKKPTSNQIIKLLWDTLNKSKFSLNINKRLMKYFSIAEQKDHIAYMYHRRRFQLSMLEATGLRPQELISIPAKSNLIHLTNGKIEIPTLKRRERHSRIIPIDKATAIKVELFAEIHRKKLIKRLIKHGFVSHESEVDDVLFLNPETGKKVKPDAAYQEFKRLSDKAGISQKNCQSMFRHRFCTNMVKLHLLSFMNKNPIKSKFNFSDSDYRTILTKVATFTGHKDPESLRYYIDLAWEELDVFSYAYDVSNLQDKLKSISRLVSDIQGDLHGSNSLSKLQMKVMLDSVLNEIENIADLSK
ncbi:tyrosine-type recombinase/integrase [Aliivibrio fischeri]|uniref:site-specific integrase n=1 Tax=Aliivibrio fischeri TaxID=668 RepID=UPI0012D99BCD|nr:site-specific integrase [Aliivibrio fischeri]MUK37864.1 tyrosine-type recombinase/integrase [Aliivibrio fischeri]MUL07123.1 tyrosine-type recombinase/integrase [Aliivibrio fischeri]